MTQITTSDRQATDLMLRVSNLNVYYGESHILRNVDLAIQHHYYPLKRDRYS